MPTTDLSNALLDLVNDPIKVSLFFEILRKPRITAKELKNTFKMEGTSIYYHLKHLLATTLVIATIESIPNSNLTQKHYHINKDVFIEKDKGILEKTAKTRLKDAVLFEFYLMSSVLTRQIQRLQQMTQDEFYSVWSEKTHFGELFFLESSLTNEVRKKYDEIRELVVKSIPNDSILELVKISDYGILFGCFPLD